METIEIELPEGDIVALQKAADFLGVGLNELAAKILDRGLDIILEDSSKWLGDI